MKEKVIVTIKEKIITTIYDNIVKIVTTLITGIVLSTVYAGYTAYADVQVIKTKMASVDSKIIAASSITNGKFQEIKDDIGEIKDSVKFIVREMIKKGL